MEGLFSFNTALTNSCGYEIKNYTRTDLQIPFNYGDKKKPNFPMNIFIKSDMDRCSWTVYFSNVGTISFASNMLVLTMRFFAVF